MSEQICPDAQSPELSVPCPTFFDTMPGKVEGPSQIPFTGFDVAWLVFVAVVVIVVGWYLIRSMKDES